MADTALASAPLRYRVRVFVDFWNYELSMKAADANFFTDWRVIGPTLSRAAASTVDPTAVAEFQGMNVYASYDDNRPEDDRLKRWATTVLDRFPGVYVHLAARQRKATGPKCPSCYSIVHRCPSCQSDMRGTEEKGVDTRIATEMISLAWANNYDIALLVSADRDFVPVAEFLQTKGIKVIHGAFPPKGALLSQKCWGSIDIPALRQSFYRPAPPPRNGGQGGGERKV